MNKIACVITAGGIGSRFDCNTPKQFYKINNKFILQITIEKFLQITNNLIVVIPKQSEEFFRQNFKNISFVIGGNTRQESVLKGLQFLENSNPDFVLITDGVRPFVSQNLIKNIIHELQNGESGVIPALKIQDTIKKIENGYVKETLNREEIFAIQTPQGFKFKIILDLHKQMQSLNLTDDSLLFEKANIKVKIIEGEKSNIKITTKEDILKFI